VNPNKLTIGHEIELEYKQHTARFWSGTVVLSANLTIQSFNKTLSSRRIDMATKTLTSNHRRINAQPRIHQRAKEIQKYGTVTHALPLDLEEPVRLEMTEQLNQMLADTMTVRDLYKKSHWQVAGPTFYPLHLLYDKHFGEQSELVDAIAERIQLLGGLSIAMAPDVAETTRIERPPRGREEVPVQLSRLLDGHRIIIGHCRELAERADKLGDDGTNDLVVSDVLRTNEMQVWFLSQHLVNMPLVEAVEGDDEAA
jgi:starvation-inducible DNA-binding protein